MEFEFQECLGARLRRLSRIVDNSYREYFSDYNITENQVTIIFTLSKIGEIEQGKLGEVLALERSTVSRNINLLFKRNYIQKSSDYRPKISLTKQGNALVKELKPKWDLVMNSLHDKIGDEGFQILSILENKI